MTVAAYYMEGKAHHWWQWLCRIHQQKNRVITWRIFEDERWSRFGPPAGVDFNEALKNSIKQDPLSNIKKSSNVWGIELMGGPRRLSWESSWED